MKYGNVFLLYIKANNIITPVYTLPYGACYLVVLSVRLLVKVSWVLKAYWFKWVQIVCMWI